MKGSISGGHSTAVGDRDCCAQSVQQVVKKSMMSGKHYGNTQQHRLNCWQRGPQEGAESSPQRMTSEQDSEPEDDVYTMEMQLKNPEKTTRKQETIS